MRWIDLETPGSDTASARTRTAAADLIRLRVFLLLAGGLNAAFCVVDLGAGAVLRSGSLLATAGVHLLIVPITVLTLALVRRGRAVAAATWAAYATIAFPALASPLVPSVIPAMVLLPLIGVVASLPFVAGRQLQRVLVACIASEAAVGATRLLETHDALPAPVTDALFIISLISTASVMLLLLWQYNARLRETLAQVRASEERFRSLVAATAQVIWVTGPGGDLAAGEQGWREFTGQSREELQRGGWLEAVHPRDRERVARAWQDALERRSPYVLEYRLRRPDGSYTPAVVRAAPVMNEDGTIREWVGINIDLTERLASDRVLRRALEARDDFLGQASHELRTPLTPLKLQVQLLRAEVVRSPGGGVPVERIAPRLDIIERQVTRLSELISDLLDVSQIDTGNLGLELADVDVAALAREAVDRHRELLRQAGCAVVLRGVDTAVVGRWDRKRLLQLFGHLLTNACRYGAGRPVELSVEADGGTARFSVRDHGIGIAPEDQARIFERFERASSSRHYGGVGLGLWICRQVATELGGEISVESQPGQGATFTVSLPRSGTAVQRAGA